MLRRIGSKENSPRLHRGREERQRAAHGLRPPGLQELRPAGQDHQEGLRRRLRGHRGQPAARDRAELEKIALEDEYFVKRKLYPNVDFYSGLIYEALQFPPEMFTVLFAIAAYVGLAGAVAGAGRRTRTRRSPGPSRSTPATAARLRPRLGALEPLTAVALRRARSAAEYVLVDGETATRCAARSIAGASAQVATPGRARPGSLRQPDRRGGGSLRRPRGDLATSDASASGATSAWLSGLGPADAARRPRRSSACRC